LGIEPSFEDPNFCKYIQNMSIKMCHQDLFMALHLRSQSAAPIHRPVVEAFSGFAISCATVSRTVRKMSSNPSNDQAQNFDGLSEQPSDVQILKRLDYDSGRGSGRWVTRPLSLCRRYRTFEQRSSGMRGENVGPSCTLSAMRGADVGSQRVRSS
jgi:hypothetical protein